MHAALKIVLRENPGPANAVLSQMEVSHENGIEVTVDVYSYTVSFAGISTFFSGVGTPPDDYKTVRAERGKELRTCLPGQGARAWRSPSSGAARGPA